MTDFRGRNYVQPNGSVPKAGLTPGARMNGRPNNRDPETKLDRITDTERPLFRGRTRRSKRRQDPIPLSPKPKIKKPARANHYPR